MGTWGKGLYEDDFSCDIRDEYLQGLKLNKNNLDITKEMIDKYGDNKDLCEKISFWVVLADTQWDHGRLLNEVKNKALSYIENQEIMSKWASEWECLKEYKLKEIAEISQKLKSEMPEPVKIKKQKIYKCEWKTGDIYRYILSMGNDCEIDKKYVYFVKCGENIWHPGHICPEIYILRGIHAIDLNINDLSKLKIMPQFYVPAAYKKHGFSEGILCRLLMLSTSKKAIPSSKIKLIGNTNINEKIEIIEERDSSGICNYPIRWKDFDTYIIKNWHNWEDNLDLIDKKFDLSAFSI